MKTTFTFCISFLTALLVNAQSISIDFPISLVEGTLSNLPTGELEADWGIVNLSSTPVSVKARRQIINEVAGSSNYFCWGVCYDAATTVSILAQTIAPGDTNHTFYAHYLPAGNAGVTTINYRFYLESTLSDYAEQAVVFCVDADCAAVIKESNPTSFLKVIGAQPSNGVSSIQYAVGNSNATFEVWSSSGQLVKRVGIKNKQGQIVLNAQEFSNGTYVLRLVDGLNSTTQRWMVQN